MGLHDDSNKPLSPEQCLQHRFLRVFKSGVSFPRGLHKDYMKTCTEVWGKKWNVYGVGFEAYPPQTSMDASIAKGQQSFYCPFRVQG